MNMDREASTFDQYFIVGHDTWLTTHIKKIILKNRNYISPVFKSLFALFDTSMRSPSDNTLVLMDISILTVEDLLKLISTHQLKNDGYMNLSIVFFNVSKNALAFPFLCIPGIRGFFQRDIDDALIATGIAAVSRGELWFPPDLLSEVTDRVRTDTAMHFTESIQLTGKERAVLRSMSVGAFENEIIDNTQVDFSTIKQQIGVIYKKLNIKNHTTAARIAGSLVSAGS